MPASVFGLALAVMALAGGVRGNPGQAEEQELRMTFETPHTKWCRPCASAARATSVMFLSAEIHVREMVELRQRFDMTADAAFWVKIVDRTNYSWHGAFEGGMERLSNLFVNVTHDVYLFAGVPPANLTTPLRAELERQVAAGAGLVMMSTSDGTYMGTPVAGRPQEGDPEASLFSYGAGRVAVITAPSYVDFDMGWEIVYDLWQQKLGRAVLWAAKLKPPVHPVLAIAQDGGASRVSVRMPPGSLAAGVSAVRIRERKSDGLRSREVVLSLAADNQTLLGAALPRLVAGTWHADVLATNRDGKVVTWAVTTFSVTSTSRVALALNDTWGEIGDTFRGVVKLSCPYDVPISSDSVLVELRDRRGRVLMNFNPVLQPGTSSSSSAPTRKDLLFAFEVNVQDWFPMLVHVRAVLIIEGAEIHDSAAFIHVVKRRRDTWNFLSWDVPRGITAIQAQDSLYRLGVQVQLISGNPPRMMAAFEMPTIAYTTRILNDMVNGSLKPAPWNKVPDIDVQVQSVVNSYAKSRRHGVYAYSLGDEVDTKGSDLTPSDMAAYREYLRGTYRNVTALNGCWGTSFTTFDDVQLLNASEPLELKAKVEGNLPRWYDRQAWGYQNFHNLCARFGAAFKKLDPQAITGFEGAGSVGNGDDIDGFVRTNGFWSPYPGTANEVVRSIAPSNFPHSNWIGYSVESAELIDSYWSTTMDGAHGMFWWRWSGIGRFIGLLRPDYTISREIRELFEDTRITREGLGDLLTRSNRVDDGIAILYSMPSAHAVQARSESYGRFSSAHEFWQKTLRGRLRLGFRYVTNAMLAKGELGAGVKVLILPRAEALSRTEAQVVSSFAENGGLVLADVRPGLLDGHLRAHPSKAGILDDLFGINSTGSSLSATSSASITVQMDSDSPALQVTGVLLDSGTKATGARTLGNSSTTKMPVVFSRSVGSKGGRAVLLNFAILERASGLVGKLLESAGVRPVVSISVPPSSGIVAVYTNVWSNGDAILLGCKPSSAGNVSLILPYGRRAFNLRSRIDLGFGTSFNVSLPSRRGTFFLLIPDALPRIAGSFSHKRSVRPGTVAELAVSVPGAFSDHAALMTLTKPDGSEADWAKQVVVIPRGRTASVKIPVALNDPDGTWHVHLQDVFGVDVDLPLVVSAVDIPVSSSLNRVSVGGINTCSPMVVALCAFAVAFVSYL